MADGHAKHHGHEDLQVQRTRRSCPPHDAVFLPVFSIVVAFMQRCGPCRRASLR
jgi:hypothetical protein